MKIAFVDEDLSLRTGSRRFTYEVTRELKRMGHEVALYTMRLDKSSCFDAYRSLPVNVVSKREFLPEKSLGRFARSHPRVRENFLIKTVNYLTYRLSEANLVMNMSLKIAESDCDVAMVHYHGEHWLMPYFYYAKKAMGVVYLNVTAPLRGSRALPFQELPLDALLVDKALRLAPVCRWEGASLKEVRMFVAPSRYLLRNAEKQGMTGEKRGEVVPLGVNHSVFFPTGEEEPFALYVGRIHPHKSLELAIMAMAGTSTDESLVIAGDVSDGYQWYLQKLVQLAEKMKVADRVKIVKSPSDVDVVRLMQTCSVFLFPSTIDTFGLVVLEAMACGKPVIACNRGGVPEVIGNAGFLLEPNTQQWQKTVGRVLSDSQTRREMGEKAFERSESFSWENTTDRLICSFEHLND